ncbi:hypothetical protein B0H13DRAFT_1853587 [Mycena leptocephala]|nr:hypothetical protein B0H13DRAFT_1853587 [Mycena leptocephala]
MNMVISDPETHVERPAEETHSTVHPPRTTPPQSPTTRPEVPNASRKRPRATVEDVEDEDDRWVQPFPKERQAGAKVRICKTQFQNLRDEQTKKGNAPWEPFESEDEWEMAHWLMTSGLSGKKTDSYLKLKKLLGDEVDAEGDQKREIVEMWCSDPVDCVRELVGNPAFTKQAYEPSRIFKSEEDGEYIN